MAGTVKIITGDLLTATESYLAHQCNCVSIGAKGIAKSLFLKFSYANNYKYRTKSKESHSMPGTIDVFTAPESKSDQPAVINMYAQKYPSIGDKEDDTKALRLKWFKECLFEIGKREEIKSIAMPYLIGCGLGGGDWKSYLKLIQWFAEEYGIKVVLYQLPK